MAQIMVSAVNIMTPLLFAATGGLFTELAGMLNIALEGFLLMGAFSAVAAVWYTGSFAAGIAAGIAGSLILSALLGAAALKLKSNVFIAGLAVNLFASGFTVILSNRFFGTRGVVVLKALSPLPEFSPYIYAGWVFLFAAWIVLYRTPFGYRLRASALNEQALRSLGLRPDNYRFAAFLVSGLACGIGGSFLSLNLGAFVPNISAGRGWIALVVIYLGGRKPLGLFAAAFIFGLADAFSNYAQGVLEVPSDFILVIPYIFTLAVMVGVSVYTRRKR
jgi:simple sugar transport system permease protein